MDNLTKVLIPPLEYEDNNSLDPQVLTSRAPNTPYVYIDSTVGRSPTSNANNITISSPNNNILINRMRRIALKNLELFYYLDNIITGFNDVFQIIFKTQPPTTPITEIITVTIPQGNYTIEELGDELQILLDAWITANWGSVPLPTITVTYTATGGIFGRLTITGIYDGEPALIAIDPFCTFVTNNEGMLALTRSNDFINPTTEELKLSFYSNVPYRYIDVISYALTKDTKATSTNNVNTNYKLIYRINRPQMGFNEYKPVEPLNWININIDTCLTMIDFQFLGPDGVPLRSCISRDFNFIMEIAQQR